MPLKNYTTEVSARKTVGEIQEILARVGARQVNIIYGLQDGKPTAVEFALVMEGRMVFFRLPSDWRRVKKVLEEDGVRSGYRTEEHARNVSWRIVKDWIDSQMAFFRSGQVELPQLFLPYAISPDTGETLYERFRGDRLLEKRE